MRKNTIKQKIIFLLTVVIIGFSVFALILNNQINKIDNLALSIKEKPVIIFDASTRAEKNVIKIHSAMKDLILVDTDAEIIDIINKVDEYEDDIYEEINIIRINEICDVEKELVNDCEELLKEWKIIRTEVIELKENNELLKAKKITMNKGADNAQRVEEAFSNLIEHNKSHLYGDIDDIENKISELKLVSLIILLILGLIISITTYRIVFGVIKAIDKLKTEMVNVIKTKEFKLVEVSGEDELSELSNNFNLLIIEIEKILKSKENILNSELILSKEKNLEGLKDIYLKTCAEFTNSSYAAIYIYDSINKTFKYSNGYAVDELKTFKIEYKLGEGLIGQVGKDLKAISLENNNDEYIEMNSAVAKIHLKNILIYPICDNDNQIVAVVEIASLEKMNDEDLQFLETSKERLYSNYMRIINKDEILELLDKAEKTNFEIEMKSGELENTMIELENMNIELKELNNEIDIANNTKSEFLVNMSHELRTPLNSIILLSDVLNKSLTITEKEKEKVAVIKSAGLELLELINNLLDISKIESGKVNLIFDAISTNELSEKMKIKFNEMFKKKEIEYLVRDNAKINFISDKVKLEQILTNFLSNAYKFTKKGYVKLIFDKSDIEEYDLKISVIDSGIGINNDKLNIIFEKFRQADGTITREFGGTGLGLSLISELASLLKGKITVKSNVNEGSVFSIYIPSNMRDMKTINNKNDKISFPMENNMNLLKDKSTILLIEDDLEFIEIIKPYITSFGYQVLVANTGMEGIKMAFEIHPSGIILDLVLPDVNGSKVIKEIKMKPETRDIPIHILSVKDNDEAITLNMLGAIGYTKKTPNVDIDAKEVMQNIQKVIDKVPKSLLIVEDDENQMELMKSLFEDWNIKVKLANNIESAINELKEENFDAIILDLVFDEGSGWDVCEYVKKNNIESSIIIYTAKTLSENEFRKLEIYSESIILKNPDSIGRLLEEVAIFMHKVHDWKFDIKLLNENRFQFLENKKILVCDDDTRNIFALSSIFEAYNVDIMIAYNGKEAIDILLENPDINLVLMDIMMPVMDGEEAIKRIRDDYRIKDIPIIVITAKAMKGDKEKILEMGANDYMSKPLDMDILMELINFWIRS